MNGHTPGPYHITQTVWTPDGLHIPWEVLQDCYWIHGEEKPLNFLGIALVTEKANANLIAASPIMYQFIAKEAEQGNPEAQQLMEMIDATSQQSDTRHTD